MSEDEVKTEETKYNWREEPGARAMMKKISDLEARLESQASAEAEAKKAAEQKELEAAGEYKTIMAKKDAEIENMKTTHAQQIQMLQLDVALTEAGITNKLLRKGAKADYDGGDIGEYVNGLVASDEVQALLSAGKANEASKFARPGSKSNVKTLDERVADGDPDAQREKLGSLLGINFRS